MRAQQIVAGWGVGVGVAVLALTVGLAGAATRFVAPTGIDSGNTCLASGSPCQTITRALSQAAANDTIQAAAGTYNTALGEIFPLSIVIDLTLTGAGAGSTIIDATGANSGVIMVGFGQTATIAGVKITGGAVSCTNSGTGECNAVGGGLGNFGTLTVTNSTVSGNTATCTNSGSGNCSGAGAGLSNFGTLTVTNSTASGNTATCTNSGGGVCTAQGGGLFSSSSDTLTVMNSTASGNTVTCTNSGGGDSSCHSRGGGLGSFSTLTVTNVTVTANTVTCSGAGCTSQGGGLSRLSGTATLQNTIIAKQVAGADCSGAIISNDFNLDSDNTCQLTQPGDKPNVSNPLLGPLADNGGPTLTHALLSGSPAIDGGPNSDCPPIDQRGFRRPVDGDSSGTAKCDIGAFELVSIATTLLGATLPTQRTALVGGSAVTAFATVLNTGAATALGCALAPFTPVQATFLYQTTTAQNQLTGTVNTPATIPPGAGQNYLFAFTPTAAFAPTEVQLSMACTNSAPAPVVSGVNTFRLRATAAAAPDPVALAATGPPNDGILRLASEGAFAVATINLGAPGLLTVSADTGAAALPVTITLCETNSQTGQCPAAPTPTVQRQLATNETATFGVFVTNTTPIPFDPATNRIQVHLEGGGGGGGTGVAVCSVPLCP